MDTLSDPCVKVELQVMIFFVMILDEILSSAWMSSSVRSERQLPSTDAASESRRKY
jgi:hypothetical protein